ncbi:glycosyltransferase family 1 protein [Panus rudis PR-1116 ss-1]|nr:glycosyltransferase family 1 protein [Panus rudis PR-1116 ss-1]
MYAFVTVGSTRFDRLVQRALSDAVLDVLRAKGYSKIVVQCGNSEFDTKAFQWTGETWVRKGTGDVEVWRFKPSLKEEYEQADLVISHAGSGTILDVLRLRKPLIVIPNETLMDNHQEELASALAHLRHLKASTIAELPKAIETLEPSKIVPFPVFDGSRFRELLDEEMGYV